jgi:hypothetical protein
MSARTFFCTFVPIIIVSCIFFSYGVHADTLEVPGQYPSIQDALNAVQDGDTVNVHPGEYRENLSFPACNCVLTSDTDPDETIIHGDLQGSVITFKHSNDPATVVEGFTITGGSFSDGGGIYCSNSSPTIRENIIMSNSASLYGGGIALYHSSAEIISNQFFYNEAGIYGGGVYSYLGEPVLKHNEFAYCTANAGGGAYCSRHSDLKVEFNDFHDNAAYISGGGLSVYDGVSGSVYRNTFTANLASYGGGGMDCFFENSVSITRNLFVRNEADYGGGIRLYCDTSSHFNRNTLRNNLAFSDGGGCYIKESNWEYPMIDSNIIVESLSGGGIFVDDTAPLICYNDVWENQEGDYIGCDPGEGDISTDPRFVGGSPFSYALMDDSPCIDTGNPSLKDSLDLSRGDIGAFPFTHTLDLEMYPDGMEYSPGDSVSIMYEITNPDLQPQNVYYRITLKIPRFGQRTYDEGSVSIDAGDTLVEEIETVLPSIAPEGEYKVSMLLGIPPYALYDKDSITFTVVFR